MKGRSEETNLKYYHDIMVDIETGASTPQAAVVSIGAVVNYKQANMAPMNFEINIKPEEYDGVFLGQFDVSIETMCWWAEQQKVVRDQAFMLKSGWARTLVEALEELNSFVSSIPEHGRLMWSKGSTFDLVVLRHAYKQCGLVPAWHFRDERCFRTKLAEHTGNGHDYPSPLIDGVGKHGALYDAKYQAQQLAMIRQRERVLHEES